MAFMRRQLQRPHTRTDVIVCTTPYQSGDGSLYCIVSWILSAFRKCSSDSVKKVLRECYVNTYGCGNISFGRRWSHTFLSYDAPPAASNKREAVGVCHGNLTTLHGFVGAHFVVTINIKFIGLNAIKLLQSENTFVLTKILWYQKHLSTS